MGIAFGAQRLKPADLEVLLGRVMVPVEPEERFATRLRARLIELRGARPARGWVTLAAVVGLGVAAAIWLGTAMRLVIAGMTILSFVASRRRRRRRATG